MWPRLQPGDRFTVASLIEKILHDTIKYKPKDFFLQKNIVSDKLSQLRENFREFSFFWCSTLENLKIKTNVNPKWKTCLTIFFHTNYIRTNITWCFCKKKQKKIHDVVSNVKQTIVKIKIHNFFYQNQFYSKFFKDIYFIFIIKLHFSNIKFM